MPKAARRESGPSAVRTEPYPPIRPGDKPPQSAAPALTEKSSKELNKPTKTTSTTKTSSPPKTTSSTTNPAPEPRTGSFLTLTLPRESSNSVPIHDTCTEIRRKINLLLTKDNLKPENGQPGEFKKDGTPKPYTKASFCKDLDVSTRVLDTFMKAKKTMGGAESQAYVAAYIFFEKKRVWEGRKKTAGRLKVEEDMPNGLPLRDPNKMRLWLRKGEDPRKFLNKYGN